MRHTVILTRQAYVEVEDLLSQVHGLRAQTVRHLVLDMGQVEILDSMLLGQLVRLKRNCIDASLELQLDNVSPHLERIMMFSGVGELFGFATPDPPRRPRPGA